MAVRGSKAKNVGKKLKSATKIKKVNQNFSPQAISNFKNKLTVSSQKVEQKAIPKARKSSKGVTYVKAGVSAAANTNIFTPKIKVTIAKKTKLVPIKMKRVPVRKGAK
jgi:hypothetical protein